MGLRDRIKSKLQSTVNRLSGEYSAAAPEERTPYEVPGGPQEDVEIVWAKLKRPREKGAARGSGEDPRGEG